MIRVQKQNETLSEAASLLAKAMKTKQSKKSILIQTSHYGLFEEQINYNGMEIVKAPALQIKKILKLKN